MTGKETAWRTLNLERVAEPCLLANAVMDARFFEEVTGQDFEADPLEVAVEAYLQVGANLCPQLSLPVSHSVTRSAYDGPERVSLSEYPPQEVRNAIESLPEPEGLDDPFDLERARDDYARSIIELQDMTGDDMLWLAGFGRADFIGGFAEWRYENYLECLALYPDHMRRYYEYTGHQAALFNTAIVEAVRTYDLAPFVFGGEDLCFSEGPICSPDLMRELYFPALARSVRPLVENDIRIVWQCSGNVLPILDDLIEVGVSGFRGFHEKRGVTLEAVTGLRTKENRRPIVWGSVSSASTLSSGSVEDVQADVERCFDMAGPGGGFALASSSAIMPETPVENILSLYEHGRAYGRRVLA